MPELPPRDPFNPTEMLTPAQVALAFHVDIKSVTRWAKLGRFPEGSIIRTPGGHRRYRRDAVEAMLHPTPAAAAAEGWALRPAAGPS